MGAGRIWGGKNGGPVGVPLRAICFGVTFPFNIYLLALFGAGATTLISVPLWRAWCLRMGHVDDPGHRKIHAAPIPLAGGLAVVTGIFVPVLAGTILFQWGLLELGARELMVYGVQRRAPQLAAILGGALAMVILGWLDDRHELSPAVKFGGQLMIAFLVAFSGVRITLFVESTLFSYAITLLWILTVTNAFNFMDNMNGLCAGLGVIGAWYFASTAALQGQYLAAVMALLACGALLGFLPFNYPKATVFLGDAGSHLVGFMMAVLAILPHFHSPENPKPWAVLSPLLILAVPLIDLIWVVLIRWRLGQPFYVGDNNHLSHRLVRRGWTPARAVALICLCAAVFGAVAFL
jgi:UDP-GlcNAc:undecaprenyl-phosphate/decaprenyl-phosphate GlcNAc-1-phosphate transferase